jgi:hypothetical protein
MKTFAIVAAIIALAAVLAALLSGWPGDSAPVPAGGPSQTYPWQVEVVDGGDSAGATVRVFGLTLGRSSLAAATARFGEQPELAIFRRSSGELAIEAYFGHINLGMLLGKAVVPLDADSALLNQWFARGNKQTISESGALKVVPSGVDQAAIDTLKIASLTFLPMVRLAPDTIRLRFGEPEQRYQDGAGTDHMAWPSRGLDIALHQGRTKDVLQYRPPYQRSPAAPIPSAASAAAAEPGAPGR